MISDVEKGFMPPIKLLEGMDATDMQLKKPQMLSQKSSEV